MSYTIKLDNITKLHQTSRFRLRKQIVTKALSSSNSTREVLTKSDRLKLNVGSDRDWYSSPRFVFHVDNTFVRSLTQLYRQSLPNDDSIVILDLMSSWVSHLPPERQYGRVVGHGMSLQELQHNPQLSDFFVRDLNKDPAGWALADQSVDAVLCCCSIQYLQYPETVFTEIHRVLRPGGICIISFSNRMFYEKAIQAWRDGSEYSRVQLVKSYVMAVRDGDSGFRDIDVVKEVKMDDSNNSNSSSNAAMTLWPVNTFQAAVTSVLGMLQGGGGKDPFYAVITYKN